MDRGRPFQCGFHDRHRLSGPPGAVAGVLRVDRRKTDGHVAQMFEEKIVIRMTAEFAVRHHLHPCPFLQRDGLAHGRVFGRVKLLRGRGAGRMALSHGQQRRGPQKAADMFRPEWKLRHRMSVPCNDPHAACFGPRAKGPDTAMRAHDRPRIFG